MPRACSTCHFSQRSMCMFMFTFIKGLEARRLICRSSRIASHRIDRGPRSRVSCFSICVCRYRREPERRSLGQQTTRTHARALFGTVLVPSHAGDCRSAGLVWQGLDTTSLFPNGLMDASRTDIGMGGDGGPAERRNAVRLGWNGWPRFSPTCQIRQVSPFD